MNLSISAETFDVCFSSTKSSRCLEEESHIKGRLSEWYNNNYGGYDLDGFHKYPVTLIIECVGHSLLIYKIVLVNEEIGLVPHSIGMVIDRKMNKLAAYYKDLLVSLVLDKNFASWVDGDNLKLDENYLASVISIGHKEQLGSVIDDFEVYKVKESKLHRVYDYSVSEIEEDLSEVAEGNWINVSTDDFGMLDVKNHQSRIAYSIRDVFHKGNHEEFYPRKVHHKSRDGIVKDVTRIIDGKILTLNQLKLRFKT